jgi:hypothetical protein
VAGTSNQSAVFSTAVSLSSGCLTGCVVLFLVAPRFQRTSVLVGGLVFSCALTFLLPVADNLAGLDALCFFLGTAEQLAVSMLYVYTPESLPSSVRASVFGVWCVWRARWPCPGRRALTPRPNRRANPAAKPTNQPSIAVNRVGMTIAPYLVAVLNQTSFQASTIAFGAFFAVAMLFSLALTTQTLNLPMLESFGPVGVGAGNKAA